MAMSQLNLQVIAHNIANAGTPGYSRQRAELVTAPPLVYPSMSRPGYPQQIGTGVDTNAVRRIRDEFLDEIIRQQTGAQGRNTVIETALQDVELIFNEPGDSTLGTILDDFFAAWQDLANDPELVSTRANLREAAISLSTEFNRLSDAFTTRMANAETQLRLNIQKVNTLVHQIADINIQVSQIKGLGENPNDLMDLRDLLVEELSDIIPINTIEQADGSMSVLIGGLRIVELDKVQELKLDINPNNPDELAIKLDNNLYPELNGQGKLAGYLEVRTELIPFFDERVNKLATSIMNRVNVLHRSGFGLDGIANRSFFVDYRTAEMTGSIALPSTTTLDTTIDELGISAGEFYIEDTRIIITADDVAPGEAITLGDLLDRITDAQPFLRAELYTNVGGVSFIRLAQYNPAEKDTEISVFKGNTNFFDVVGLTGATTEFLESNDIYTSGGDTIRINPAILDDLDIIAAAGDDGSGYFPGPGNNDNAIGIASLHSLNTALLGTTFNDYYVSSISELGSQSQSAMRLVTNQGILLEQLYTQRESVRGVNLDEEATNMITYQRIYEGAARVTAVVDSMLDTLINRMAA